MNWHPPLSSTVITILVLAGLGAMAASYLWSRRQLNPASPAAMATIALRLLAFFLLLFFLLQPMRLPKPREISSPRTLAVLIDTSGSMSKKMSDDAPARLDEARQASELAAQQITALEQDLKRIAASLGGAPDTPLEQHPSYRAAAAELAQAKLDLERTVVRAPLAGTVSKPPKPGQYVAAGATAMALVATGHVWVEANFTETDLTHVRPGQPVEVHVDTYPDAVWTGVVESLSPATGAEFAVIPPQNATGNWVKITQRLPLRIRLDERPGLPQLRAGLSATVDIDTGHRRKVLGLSL
jgi:multidrug resistance efflux pump